jgi:hypothetical protein
MLAALFFPLILILHDDVTGRRVGALEGVRQRAAGVHLFPTNFPAFFLTHSHAGGPAGRRGPAWQRAGRPEEENQSRH